MGMFDDVILEVPVLERHQREGRRWQTKGFDCLLDTYTVRKDGTLWVERWWESGLGEPKPPPEPYNYSGHVLMYDFLDPENWRGSAWVEYQAQFEEGRLTRLELWREGEEWLQEQGDVVYQAP